MIVHRPNLSAIDRASWDAAALAGLWPLRGTLVDIAAGRVGVSYGLGFAPTPMGTALAGDGAGYASLGRVPLTDNFSIAFTLFLNTLPNTARQTVIGSENETGVFQIEIGGTGDIGGNNAVGVIVPGVVVFSTVDDVVVRGRPMRFELTSSSVSGVTCYLNGLVQAQRINVPGSFTAGTALTIGRRASGSQGLTGYVADVRVYSMVRTAAQIFRSAMQQNAVFLRRRDLITVSTASLPTLSSATYVPGSLSSTSFRPRVTATY